MPNLLGPSTEFTSVVLIGFLGRCVGFKISDRRKHDSHGDHASHDSHGLSYTWALTRDRHVVGHTPLFKIRSKVSGRVSVRKEESRRPKHAVHPVAFDLHHNLQLRSAFDALVWLLDRMGANERAGTMRPVPEGTLLVKDIQMLLTLNSSGDEVCEGAIYVKGNVISWVGKTSEIPAEFSKADTVVSLPDRVVMPGEALDDCLGVACINCHLAFAVLPSAQALKLTL